MTRLCAAGVAEAFRHAERDGRHHQPHHLAEAHEFAGFLFGVDLRVLLAQRQPEQLAHDLGGALARLQQPDGVGVEFVLHLHHDVCGEPKRVGLVVDPEFDLASVLVGHQPTCVR